jgi:hypothetical protein
MAMEMWKGQVPYRGLMARRGLPTSPRHYDYYELKKGGKRPDSFGNIPI